LGVFFSGGGIEIDEVTELVRFAFLTKGWDQTTSVQSGETSSRVGGATVDLFAYFFCRVSEKVDGY